MGFSRVFRVSLSGFLAWSTMEVKQNKRFKSCIPLIINRIGRPVCKILVEVEETDDTIGASFHDIGGVRKEAIAKQT